MPRTGNIGLHLKPETRLWIAGAGALALTLAAASPSWNSMSLWSAGFPSVAGFIWFSSFLTIAPWPAARWYHRATLVGTALLLTILVPIGYLLVSFRAEGLPVNPPLVTPIEFIGSVVIFSPIGLPMAILGWLAQARYGGVPLRQSWWAWLPWGPAAAFCLCLSLVSLERGWALPFIGLIALAFGPPFAAQLLLVRRDANTVASTG